MLFKRLFVFITVAFLGSCKERIAPIVPTPSRAQLDWHGMEMNAFIHFSINTFTDREWGYGNESPELFNPSDLNVEQWVTTLKAAGFHGIILTAKHHDGFCLWPSRYTDHSIKNSPYKNGKGDIVREVSDACRKHGLKFGIYVSPWDRNRADYGEPSYVEYYRNQLNELFTNYGPVFEMWFDGANGGDGYYGGANEVRRINGASYYDWPATLEIVRSLSPDVIFFSDAGPGVRWVGNEKGVAGSTNWNMITPDTLYAGKSGIEQLLSTGSEFGTKWIPAEVDVSIRPGWFYHQREDTLVKDGRELFEIYKTSVGRGSTLLLNVPPDRRGLIHERDVDALMEFKKLREEAFNTNLARKSSIEIPAKGADALIDSNPETFWIADSDSLPVSIITALPQPTKISYLVLQEPIAYGQRIKEFDVEVLVDGNWLRTGQRTTIGYKRIFAFVPLVASKVKITFTQSRARPAISEIALY